MFTVEQVKGTEEMKQKIITAAKRAQDDYYNQLEMLHLSCTCDKYLNNYRQNHNHSNGIFITNQKENAS